MCQGRSDTDSYMHFLVEVILCHKNIGDSLIIAPSILRAERLHIFLIMLELNTCYLLLTRLTWTQWNVCFNKIKLFKNQ